MKFVYCAKCGLHLPIIRKAMPKYATIVDLVEPHECLEEPVPFDLKPVDNPIIDINKKENKFVQKLNELQPPPPTFGGVSTADLRDRRIDVEPTTKSTAPTSIFGMIQDMENSIPERDIRKPESED